jgi:predicted nucleic acid-binding protein
VTPATAVLDACVLVPISLCDALLELADARLYQPLWSEAILGETRKALVEEIGVPEDKADQRINAMRHGARAAMVDRRESLIDQMANHPKDRHVLAVAVKAHSTIIVTENLADFPASALSPHGVKAMRPDDFLLELAATDPEAVWMALDRKRQLYRTPPCLWSTTPPGSAGPALVSRPGYWRSTPCKHRHRVQCPRVRARRIAGVVSTARQARLVSDGIQWRPAPRLCVRMGTTEVPLGLRRLSILTCAGFPIH